MSQNNDDFFEDFFDDDSDFDQTDQEHHYYDDNIFEEQDILSEPLKEIYRALEYGSHLVDLSEMYISELPTEIDLLTNIKALNLSGNLLETLPKTIGNLQNLEILYLQDNQLHHLPDEIGNLSNLKILVVRENVLTSLPQTIGQLTSLVEIDASYNGITHLPLSLKHLTLLEKLNIDANPLLSPPPSVLRTGTSAILQYLAQLSEASRQQWVSKLVIVGEGGVGKTSLLKCLRGESFKQDEPTTHGIEIREVPLEHPTEELQISLRAWDFGGQDIYHATHQFFLTNRSLFLLLWNARLGYEQGHLYYWLDMIKLRAPESPVIIIATHVDEREARLPFVEIQRKYPQVKAQHAVSCLNGSGFEELKDIIGLEATNLPLMGEKWPETWLNAARQIHELDLKYTQVSEIHKIMSSQEISAEQQLVLTEWLHELGDILYFADDPELSDIIVLKPQWVSQYISKALTSEEIVDGIFTRQHMAELWSDIEPFMREKFLRMMEKFDLSYRIPDDLQNRSLIVERLPLSEGAIDYIQTWTDKHDSIDPASREIRMHFVLDSTLPAGIPTWFIARTHRFTMGKHWRTGALLRDKNAPDHYALIKSYPHERYTELSVRGPVPQNFFALLKDGFEVTLKRYPGIEDQLHRLIPCPGHRGEPCTHFFDYDQLIKRIRRSDPRYLIECPEGLQDIDVRRLLFGLIPDTLGDVLSEVTQIRKENTIRANELTALLQREFLSNYKRQQSIVEEHCPNAFVIYPADKRWLPNPLGQQMKLQLMCQAPGCWHFPNEGGIYELRNPARWLRRIGPFMNRAVGILKQLTPIVLPWLGLAAKEYEQQFLYKIEMMRALVEMLPKLDFESAEVEWTEETVDKVEFRTEGAQLRALRKLLNELDPTEHWGGLTKVLTPEGHYLWLCDNHRKEYE